jgi:hypothetical protein
MPTRDSHPLTDPGGSTALKVRSALTALHWAQFAALIAAALFFLFKLAQGWFTVNLSLSGSLDRRAIGGQDDLAVAVTLTKGAWGSVRVHETAVRVSWEDGECTTRLLGDRRLLIADRGKSIAPGWQPLHGRGSAYRLPPGEGTTWSCHLLVPTDRTCLIEVVVLGIQWPSMHPAQWRLSLVSLAPGC